MKNIRFVCFVRFTKEKHMRPPHSRSMGCQLLKNTEIGDCEKAVNREEQIDKQEEK